MYQHINTEQYQCCCETDKIQCISISTLYSISVVVRLIKSSVSAYQHCTVSLLCSSINNNEFLGLDGFPVECLNKGGMAVLEWLVRLLNLSFDMGVVHMVWPGACIVPLYNGTGDKRECSNLRGIRMLSEVGKLYGRVLIKRVRAGTECAVWQEQCG